MRAIWHAMAVRGGDGGRSQTALCRPLLSCARCAVGEYAGLPWVPTAHAISPQCVPKDPLMSLSLSIGPLVSLIAGILILVMPRLLSTIVALYLIIMGILGLLGMHTLRF